MLEKFSYINPPFTGIEISLLDFIHSAVFDSNSIRAIL